MKASLSRGYPVPTYTRPDGATASCGTSDPEHATEIIVRSRSVRRGSQRA